MDDVEKRLHVRHFLEHEFVDFFRKLKLLVDDFIVDEIGDIFDVDVAAGTTSTTASASTSAAAIACPGASGTAYAGVSSTDSGG